MSQIALDQRFDLGFPPDPARGQALNARMHRELAVSLRHVLEASGESLIMSDQRLAPVLAGLDSGASYPASVFAAYYELVMALLEEEPGEAEAALETLSHARCMEAGLHIDVLGDAKLGRKSQVYQQLMNDDGGVELGFSVPAPEVATAFRARLETGLALLDRALPELSGEIRAIIREIVIAGGDPTKKMQFDGGSHYRLWGALFLNGQFHPDDLAIVEVLAHESAHSLLFGFCTDQALVENEDEELFPSPLRADLRPMDGIYHATFVSARMHWAMNGLERSGMLSPDLRARARAAAASDVANFQAGMEVIEAHGRLTPLGLALIQGARDYMDGAV